MRFGGGEGQVQGNVAGQTEMSQGEWTFCEAGCWQGGEGESKLSYKHVFPKPAGNWRSKGRGKRVSLSASWLKMKTIPILINSFRNVASWGLGKEFTSSQTFTKLPGQEPFGSFSGKKAVEEAAVSLLRLPADCRGLGRSAPALGDLTASIPLHPHPCHHQLLLQWLRCSPAKAT